MVNSNVRAPYQTVEYSKFIELDRTVFPPVSVTRISYPDQSQAFPDNYNTQPVSSIDVYPKYGVLTHITNPEDISISLSAGQVNVNLEDIENLLTANNAFTLLQSYQLSGISTYVDDLEKNTFDTASACDDIYYEVKRLNTQTEILTTNSFYGTTADQPLHVTSSPESPNYITINDGPQVDAFARLRVSTPKTLVDAKHLYDKLPLLFYEKLSGTATSTFSAYDSMVVMSTSAANDFVIRQSRYHFNYQPGKSLQAFFTGKLHPQPGIIKRMGLYQSLSSSTTTPSDGIYLEVTENGPYFKIAKTQGLQHTMTFPRSAWNIDKLDGTGASGVNIAISAAQIFVLDYEWLSLGRVRFGFMQSGKTYYAHCVNHINDLDRPYITSPNQPIRYEIVQTGATPGSMHHICSTVMVEGGEDEIGKPLAISDSKVTDISTSYKALLAVRLKPIAHDSSVILKSVDILNETNNSGLYDVILNPTYVSTPFVWNDFDSAAIQYSTGGAAVSGGYSMIRGFMPGGIGGTVTSDGRIVLGEIVKLGINIDDTPDVVVLAAKAFDPTAKIDARGIMNLLERA